MTWLTRRRAALAGTLLAALAGAAISYDALAAIARDAGVWAPLSWLFPLGVDGMIAVATVGVLEVHGHARWEVWALLLAAIGVSVAGNGAHAGAGGTVVWGAITVHALWSAVPACAYAAALHLFVLISDSPPTLMGRAQETARATAPARAHRPRRRGPIVELPDGRRVSAGHARKLRARQRAMEVSDAA